MKLSIWYRLASYITKGYHPYVVVILILILGFPITFYCFQLEFSIDLNQLHPKDNREFEIWQKYTDIFGGGLTDPYAIIVVPASRLNIPEDGPMLTNYVNSFTSKILLTTGMPGSSISGPTWVNGSAINFDTAWAYLYNESDPRYQSDLAYLARFRNLGDPSYPCPHVNDSYTFYIEVDTPFDPQGPQAEDFIRNVRTVIDEYNSPTIANFYLTFGLTDNYDVVDRVFHEFPGVIGVTISVLLVIVALSFRSLVVALRLVFTVGLTLSWCFGGGVIVFQTSLFDNLNSSIAASHAIFWMGPILTFSLVIGLALDYDIFLTSRIKEFRTVGGLNDIDSIVQGYYRTGGVITTAGIIMVIAFGSLMLSSQLLLVQAGFFLSFSVFLDTFVVRSLLVPAIMALLGKWNWWPSKVD